MPVLAVGLEDRTVTLARAGTRITGGPSVVFNGVDDTTPGADACTQMRIRPRSISTRHLATLLTQSATSTPLGTKDAERLVEAELACRLAQYPVAADDRVWFAVPAQSHPAGLSAVWGIAQRLQVRVDGFVDAAAVTAAAVASDRDVIVLELGLHHAAATAVDCQNTQVRRRSAVVFEQGGLVELYQSWLELVSRTLVRRTRFDPLHDATTEQSLYAAIPHLAVAAEQAGTATAAMTFRQHGYEVDISRDQFEQAADALYKSWMGLLNPLRCAGAPVSVVVPELLACLPGLRERFEVLVGSELITVPDGFAPQVTSTLDLPSRPADASALRLLRRVPRTTGNVVRMPLGERRASGPAPSHILWNGNAYILGPERLVVGRGLSGPGSLNLPEGMAAISRRHCTFARDGKETTLFDHSSFGTFVNGERVYEKVRVYSGDRVRIGEAGVELALIAVTEGSEAAL